MESTRARAFMRCPHCGSASIVRGSYMLSEMVRESVMACRNIYCGHTFVVVSHVARTISPSAMPRDDVHLPISDHAQATRERREAQQAAQHAGKDEGMAIATAWRSKSTQQTLGEDGQ